MIAAILHGPGDVRLEERPDPEPGPGEVVIAVTAALTCGTDRKAFRYGHPAYAAAGGAFGHEFAGTVAAVGAGVARFAVGQRVVAADSAPCQRCFHCQRGAFALCEDLEFAFGGFGQLLRLPRRVVAINLHPIPPAVPDVVAALCEPLACAVKAVRQADVRDGDRVAVLGCGPLGLMLVGLLGQLGAEVVAVDPHPQKLERAGAFGATARVRARREGADVAAVRAACHGGRGPDHVFEAVGRPQSWELAVQMARNGGRVTLFGGCPTGTTVAVSGHRVHYEEVVLAGSYHHDPAAVRESLRLLEQAPLPWTELCVGAFALTDLVPILTGALDLGGHKGVVRP